MFDAIGRKGYTKPLSPWRWALVAMWGAVLVGMVWGTTQVVQSMPRLTAEKDTEPTEVTFKKFVKPPPPPPPPPPARRIPRQTTRPRRNVLTKKVVQKEIVKPTPTPIPEEDEPTPEPEPMMAIDDGGVMGGVPGGVIGGVIGGVVGGAAGFGPQSIKEVDAGDVVKLSGSPPGYPPLAKRQHITGAVMVEIHVGTDGSVTDIIWVSGNEIFREAVEGAVRGWRFAQQPIPVRFRQPFNFRLNN